MSDHALLTPQSTDEVLAHVARETHRFVEVAARSPLPAHVPTYPAFTVETLASHVGTALRVFHSIVSTGSYQETKVPVPEGPEVVEWVDAGLGPLLTVLAEVPADKLVSFPHGVGDRLAGAIAPAVAVEVGVHRWDLESVLGNHAEIVPELAALEIDTAFENFASRLAGSGVAPIGGTVQLRATDVPATWGAAVQDGKLKARRLAAPTVEAEVVVTAPVEDLAVIVWKRSPLPRAGVEITGDTTVLRQFLAIDYVPDPRTTPAH